MYGGRRRRRKTGGVKSEADMSVVGECRRWKTGRKWKKQDRDFENVKNGNSRIFGMRLMTCGVER